MFERSSSSLYKSWQRNLDASRREATAQACMCCCVYMHMNACMHICVQMHSPVIPLTRPVACLPCWSLPLPPSPPSAGSFPSPMNAPSSPSVCWHAKPIKRTFHFMPGLRLRMSGPSVGAHDRRGRSSTARPPRCTKWDTKQMLQNTKTKRHVESRNLCACHMQSHVLFKWLILEQVTICMSTWGSGGGDGDSGRLCSKQTLVLSVASSNSLL